MQISGTKFLICFNHRGIRKYCQWCVFQISRLSWPEFETSRSITSQPGDFKISTCFRVSRCPKTTSLTVLTVIFFLHCLKVRARTTDTQWRHESKKSEILGRCGRQNMLRPYLKIWQWELIFGRAVKAISSPGVCSPCLTPNKKTLQTQNFANLQAIYQEIRNYEGCERKEQQIISRFELISKAR